MKQVSREQINEVIILTKRLQTITDKKVLFESIRNEKCKYIFQTISKFISKLIAKFGSKPFDKKIKFAVPGTNSEVYFEFGNKSNENYEFTCYMEIKGIHPSKDDMQDYAGETLNPNGTFTDEDGLIHDGFMDWEEGGSVKEVLNELKIMLHTWNVEERLILTG